MTPLPPVRGRWVPVSVDVLRRVRDGLERLTAPPTMQCPCCGVADHQVSLSGGRWTCGACNRAIWSAR